MKTVAIIGAGPGGLVTAKTLLRSTACQYKVTIFEKRPEIGGLWGVRRENPYDGMLNPDMPTNVSRFNFGFSDLAWSSIGLPGHVPYWPKAWQAGQYLRTYTERYIPSESILLNTKVTSATAAGKSETQPAWRLKWESKSTDGEVVQNEGVFDYLVLATGFFGTTKIPAYDQVDDPNFKVIHSTNVRKLTDVVPDSAQVEGTLLVVGGGMSGADTSTVLASLLSDATYSPEGNESKYSKLKLVQMCPEKAYALPLAAPCDQAQPMAPNFLPLDLCMYRLEQRPPGDITLGFGKLPAEMIKTIHGAFQGLVGDQSDLGVKDFNYTDTSKAAYVTLTEQYSGYLRSGDIQVIMGRFDHFQKSSKSVNGGGSQINVVYQHNGETKTLENVVGVVYATGFTPQPSLRVLDSATQDAIDFDKDHKRLPVILDEYTTIDSKVPGFALVGMFEGPFWGHLEMQARYIERSWRSKDQQNGLSSNSKSTESFKGLRQAMIDKDKEVPQYWMGDYIGFMEEIARETGVKRNDLDFEERTGPMSHARYADDTCDKSETAKTLAELSSLISKSNSETYFVGRASFLALQGKWTIGRTITSNLSTMMSGSLTGTASFHPRKPTDPEYDFEYLYIEQGTFTMENGLTMNATRRYVYRYNEEADKITVWFVKDDGKTVDYLYHGLKFDEDSRRRGWLAKADHLCIADMYRSDYTFVFKGANVSTLGVVHAVKGPKKDYVSETWYVR